jgi:hypothetical protein
MYELVFDLEAPTSLDVDNQTINTLNARQTSHLKLEAAKPAP